MFPFLRSRRGMSLENSKRNPVGSHAVNVAIAGNSLILVAKLGA
jgi:hypothetical protein